MKSVISTVTYLIIGVFLAACNSTPSRPVSPDSGNAPAQVKELYEALNQAEQEQAHLFAPGQYEDITRLYQKSLSASSSNSQEAQKLAAAGLNQIPSLKASGQAVASRVKAIYDARSASLAAGVDSLYPNQLATVDQQLVNITRSLEDNLEAQAGDTEVRLLADNYLALELDAIKQSVLGQARQALEVGTVRELPLVTPATMAKASAHLEQASRYLDEDRTKIARAEAEATAAVKAVEHAEVLAAQIQKYAGNPNALEQVLLWHEQQLADAVEPILTQLPFNEGAAAVNSTIKRNLNQILSEKLALRQELTEAQARESNLKIQSAASLETMKQEMEQKVLAAQMETDAEKRRHAENLRRFEFVRELFALTEAEVYQQGQNVLIRAHGFKFKSGSSEIEQENLPLINKIIDAIEVFPDATIQVSGHTDNRGDSLLNQRLSEERAANVGEFIANVGKLASEKVVTQGYGPSRPVATNDSADGRAANRRVEVLIVNEQPDQG
ncbi:OmpA family protein [Hahella ganghwensis]|uniref:OmpA family protein n=1 Tax=Hahella ganghwensis TaxID=286420 RepID=UPI0012F815C0|nr:OmpA family protein [Hahella ganghwensis]